MAPGRSSVSSYSTSTPGLFERAIESLAGRVGSRVAELQIDDADPERRHRLRPYDAGIVVTGLDDGADQARDADAIGAALDRPLDAIRPGDQRLHRLGIFVAEIEDLADLDAAGVDPLAPRGTSRVEAGGIVDILGRGIERVHCWMIGARSPS